MELKNEILSLLKDRGAKYPAEHNVGHLYEADESLHYFYRRLDPTNTFNPGVGQTSRLLNWEDAGHHNTKKPPTNDKTSVDGASRSQKL